MRCIIGRKARHVRRRDGPLTRIHSSLLSIHTVLDITKSPHSRGTRAIVRKGDDELVATHTAEAFTDARVGLGYPGWESDVFLGL